MPAGYTGGINPAAVSRNRLKPVVMVDENLSNPVTGLTGLV